MLQTVSTQIAPPPLPIVVEEMFSLSAFARREESTSAERLRVVHGDAFLLHVGPLDTSRQPHNTLRTLNYTPNENVVKSGGFLAASVVFVAKSTDHSPFPDFVAIGRTRNNDVMIPDTSISKFHSYLRPTNGGLVIYDAGSQNGTCVEGRRLSAKEGALLSANTPLRLGALELTFLDACALHSVIQRL